MASSPSPMASSSSQQVAPSPSPIEKLILKYFPEAKLQRHLLKRAILMVDPSDRANLHFATSCCSDEINRDLDRDLETYCKAMLRNPSDRVFAMGGLAGFPFVGKTGFEAFMHHVPERIGAMFVICASHIGITEEGTLGLVKRHDMKKPSAACGAAVGALNAARDKKPRVEKPDSFYDYQQEWIQKVVDTHLRTITSPSTENLIQKRLAEVISEAILRYFRGILPSKHLECPLYILSGVQINVEGKERGEEEPDYFYPTAFEKIGGRGQQTNLLSKLLKNP